MSNTNYPTLSALADILCCRAIVVLICILFPGILLPGLFATSALAAAEDASVSAVAGNASAGAAPIVAAPIVAAPAGAAPLTPAVALAATPPIATATPAAAAALPTFSIYEFTVDGNSLFTALTIENILSGFMGEGKTLPDLEGARTALERAYHDAGYLTVLVTIPEQRVDEGVVALHVVEARIGRLRVKGGEYTTPSKIKARVPELAEGKVPNFKIVQAELSAMNRDPNLKVTPILRAGKEPGTVEVQLDVIDQFPLHGSVEFSNRQSPNTTPQRLSASLRYDNLWQRAHSFGLTVQTAPQRTTDARVLAGAYVVPMNFTGDTLTMYAVHSRSQFASLSGAPELGLLGNTDTFGGRYTWQLASSSGYAQTFSAGMDYKDTQQTLLLPGGVGTDSPITYVPLVATYTGSWSGAERSTMFDITATTGLRSFFGNNDAAFNAKRSGASASFLALRSGLLHNENFSGWSLNGKLEMQLCSGPLLPMEQFQAGGAESVRGYLEGEQAGDSGLLATIELRTKQFNLGAAGSEWRWSGLAFIDAAQLAIRQPIAPQPEVQRLRGTGMGLRFSAPGGVIVEVDFARALRNSDLTRAGTKRIHARALWAF